MTVIGSANSWIDLLESKIPELLLLVIDSWNDMAGPLPNNRETTITKVLCRKLRANRRARDLMFLVGTEEVVLDPAPGQPEGREDIVFRPTGRQGAPDEEIYLCLECKRLRFVSGTKLHAGGAEYVKDGMMRFVNAQYAKEVKNGGMLGYVLDGNIPLAIKNIEINVRKNCSPLSMDHPATLHPSAMLPHIQEARESLHKRSFGVTPFYVHHLFVKAHHLFP